MRRILKSTEPASLKRFRNSHPQAIWEDLHKKEHHSVYEDCLERSLSDQKNLCGYTELSLNKGQIHLDHYVKRQLEPRLTFDWNNLIAAVINSQFGAVYKDNFIKQADYDSATCKYKDLLNPVVDSFCERFVYNTNGQIMPAKSDDKPAIHTIEAFNLNESSLCYRRKSAMEMVRNILKGCSLEDARGYLSDFEFASAVEYEIAQFCNDQYSNNQ